jgi:uncharacterized protein HemX
MDSDSSNNGAGAGLLLGAGLATLVAVAHNAAKNTQHQREIRQIYNQGCIDGARRQHQADAQELARLQNTLREKDAELARLNTTVVNQAKELAGLKALSPKPDATKDGSDAKMR